MQVSGSRLRTQARRLVFDAKSPLHRFEEHPTHCGPSRTIVNFAYNANGHSLMFPLAVSMRCKSFAPTTSQAVATIPVGKLPHGVWPSGDGSRTMWDWKTPTRSPPFDTLTNTVIATIPIGQAPQAVNYVPNAVPEAMGRKVCSRLAWRARRPTFPWFRRIVSKTAGAAPLKRLALRSGPLSRCCSRFLRPHSRQERLMCWLLRNTQQEMARWSHSRRL